MGRWAVVVGILLICVPGRRNVSKRLVQAMARFWWFGHIFPCYKRSPDGFAGNFNFLRTRPQPRRTYCQLHCTLAFFICSRCWAEQCPSTRTLLNIKWYQIFSVPVGFWFVLSSTTCNFLMKGWGGSRLELRNLVFPTRLHSYGIIIYLFVQ